MTKQRAGRKPRPLPEPITEGQRLLQVASVAQRLTLEQIAAQVGTSPAPVMLWLRGETRPNVEMRARLAGAFGISPHAWDQRCQKPANGEGETSQAAYTTAPPPAGPPPAPPLPARSTSTLESCLNVLDDIRGARSDVQLLPSERIKLADAEARILALRARLERDVERTEDRMVREHPEWQRLKRAILKALLPHPAALKDVTAAIGEDAAESNGHSS